MGEAGSAETTSKDSCTAGDATILIQPVKEPVYIGEIDLFQSAVQKLYLGFAPRPRPRRE